VCVGRFCFRASLSLAVYSLARPRPSSLLHLCVGGRVISIGRCPQQMRFSKWSCGGGWFGRRRSRREGSRRAASSGRERGCCWVLYSRAAMHLLQDLTTTTTCSGTVSLFFEFLLFFLNLTTHNIYCTCVQYARLILPLDARTIFIYCTNTFRKYSKHTPLYSFPNFWGKL
jgi:hypothetical protein